MFVPETSPAETRAAAVAWAAAYTDYVVAGGIPARPRQSMFADALTTAFNPALAGGGPALFLSAFQVFWVGLPVPAQTGIVVAFVPVGSVNSPQPDNATPAQQANGLATVISTLTLGAVKVQVPPGVIVPIL